MAKIDYQKKVAGIAAEQFNASDDLGDWPDEVSESGGRYWYTPWASDASYKRPIFDGAWICCDPPPEGEEGENYLMAPEDFAALWEPKP